MHDINNVNKFNTNRMFGIGCVWWQKRSTQRRLEVVHRLGRLRSVWVVLDLHFDAARVDGIANRFAQSITVVAFRTAFRLLDLRTLSTACHSQIAVRWRWRRRCFVSTNCLISSSTVVKVTIYILCCWTIAIIARWRRRRGGFRLSIAAAVWFFVVDWKWEYYSHTLFIFAMRVRVCGWRKVGLFWVQFGQHKTGIETTHAAGIIARRWFGIGEKPKSVIVVKGEFCFGFWWCMEGKFSGERKKIEKNTIISLR